ncbi:putative pinoresinol-lariciresinol reductase 3 [Sparassis crispa]|uniref:Putative pinoresinol-lariciresinol reductase 3 n=1 Tax=Sparassis crispa TaxID=139825 RepID=A0A401G9S1_9APHY|nr:putative pinoresinol-lariciresinol reductase 3 [Sparassis crispa]GBE78915.1 putative pinoresinol-lariciresinol reductase 3 [Sparassis crispa]
MSYLTSTRLSRAQYVVAIAGATGTLGREVTAVFLGSYRPFFSRVIALVRDPSSSGAQALAAKGAELHQLSESDPLPSLVKALEGVDVVVNALPPGPENVQDALVKASVERGVKVYFPSEYGVDHRKDYWGYKHPAWLGKREHDRRARARGQGKLKVIEVYIGLFLELCLTPFLGFDHANNLYTFYGSPNQRVSWTSKGDIGRALAELSLVALSPELSTRVPDYVRLSGETINITDIRESVQRVRKELGHDRGEIVLKSEDLENFKKSTQEAFPHDPKASLAPYLRLAMAEGELDLSVDNNNDLVNPDQSVWKWKTVEDFARENNAWS